MTASTSTPIGGPTVTLNNPKHQGQTIPLIGLGTWQSPKGEVENAVHVALAKTGYRHIDGAYCYGNENEVGAGIAKALADGKKDDAAAEAPKTRGEVFVTSKLWNTHHRKEHVRAACEKSLGMLFPDKKGGISEDGAYLDLYLIHWPQSMKFVDWETNFPFRVDPDDKLKRERGWTDPVDLMETWKAMEDLVLGEGDDKPALVKAIGVSNFNEKQLNYILKHPDLRIPPAVNQIEVHPYFQQEKLVSFCKENKIAVQCYSPLGSPERPAGMQANKHQPAGKAMEDATLVKTAEKLGVTPQVLALRFQIARGLIVLPKSVTESRIEANLKKTLEGHPLAEEDAAVIRGIDKDFRLCVPMVPRVDDETGKEIEGEFMFRDGFMPEFPFCDEIDKLNGKAGA